MVDGRRLRCLVGTRSHCALLARTKCAHHQRAGRWAYQGGRNWSSGTRRSQKRPLEEIGHCAVVGEVDLVIVEYPNGQRLEECHQKPVLGVLRACIIECEANEGGAIIPTAVPSRRFLKRFKVANDATDSADCAGAVLVVCKGGFGGGKVGQGLQPQGSRH